MLNRRAAPAATTVRVVRNRWSDLESAPPEDWAPRLTRTVCPVGPGSVVDAQAAAARSQADLLVFVDHEHEPDQPTLDKLSWWQHVCHYAVSVASDVDPGGEDDWLTAYQRESDQLNRAGYEAFRGAAAGAFVVARELFETAGGIDVTAGADWQLDLAYRLAQRGAVFVAATDTKVSRASARTDTAALTDRIPLLPERRPDWRQSHAVPTLHVVVDCATAPDAAAATIDGVLDGEFRDLSISVVGWTGATAPSDDPRLALHAAAQPSFPIPFRLELPAGCVLAPYSVRRMLNRMRESQLGLYQALVEPNTDVAARSLAVRLMRSSAIERFRWLNVDDGVDDAIDEMFGSTWVDGQRFGLRHYADADRTAVHDPEDDDEPVIDDEDNDDDDDE